MCETCKSFDLVVFLVTINSESRQCTVSESIVLSTVICGLHVACVPPINNAHSHAVQVQLGDHLLKETKTVRSEVHVMYTARA